MRRLILLLTVLSASSVPADEGMWTFDNFPSKTVAQRYGFEPDAAWLEGVRLGMVRLGGCSGSFVSPDGLVLTNYHCVAGCVQRLSTAERDLEKTGWVAAKPEEELACRESEITQLVEIRDVTAQIRVAVDGLEGGRFNDALKAEKAKLERACAVDEKTRCDLVSLYQGGLHHLYRYRRYADVRLAWAPEFAIGFFGGDPDNFNFPRWNLDAALLRVWEDGKPAPTPHHFPLAADGAREGDLVFVPGNPGGTSRLDTVADLQFALDSVYPRTIPLQTELRGVLSEFATRSPEAERVSRNERIYLENSIKVWRQEHRALLDAELMAVKTREERELRERVEADPELKERYGDAWERIARALDAYRPLAERAAYVSSTSGFRGDLFSWARSLVRAAAELPKPDAERLPEFASARLPRLRQGLLAPKPVSAELEVARLSYSLEAMRRALGPDDPFVRRVLGARSPREAAETFVSGSRLGDPAVRKALLDGGQAAIDASEDAMIRLAALVDPEARALRRRIEDEIESVLERNRERVGKARFEVYGTSVYPDATFSPRLSFGAVRGWIEKGEPVPPFTTLRGLFARATGREPYALPERWLAARDRLDLDTPFNFVTTNDITGGNSGSAVVDRTAHVLGVAFDGNLHSIGGEYLYDPARNRMVAVDARAILAALEKVYGAKRLAEELRKAMR
ncbi:MAG TPA: S46 family peptidase [Candidatus Polarisedimenticolaceae bacterium]